MTLAETLDHIRKALEPNGSAAARGGMHEAEVHPLSKDVKRRAQAVAAVAAAHADAVDAEGRFPHESVAAARAQRLFGILVPTELGGEGASVRDVVGICDALGRACGATAMIYAMHQLTVACLARHAGGSPWHGELMRRLAREQLLLASSTTEGQGGGDLRKSDCAVVRDGGRISLAKSATVVSYGAQADGIVTTARRSPDAPLGDQVLVAFLKDDYRLEVISDWDTLGMRGTCSTGFRLEARGRSGQILPDLYHTIHAHTVVPVAHLTWSAVWAGIAAGAVERARQFIRNAARKQKGELPPGASHLTRASATLQLLQAGVASALHRYEAVSGEERALESLDFQTAMNLLKVNSSELSISAVRSALQACGLAGYRNDGPFSVARHLRDVLSSPVMISNDRILGNVASAALLVEVPALLGDPSFQEATP